MWALVIVRAIEQGLETDDKLLGASVVDGRHAELPGGLDVFEGVVDEHGLASRCLLGGQYRLGQPRGAASSDVGVVYPAVRDTSATSGRDGTCWYW